MHDVEPVVEHVAQGRVAEGQARQLAVDRIQHAHAIGAEQSGDPPAQREERHRGEGQHDRDPGHRIGMHAQARQRPHRGPDQRRIDVLGEEIGRALVGRLEHEALELGALSFAVDAPQPEGKVAAQHRDMGGEILLPQLADARLLQQSLDQCRPIGDIAQRFQRRARLQSQQGDAATFVGRDPAAGALAQLGIEPLIDRNVAGRDQKRPACRA